MSLAGTGIRFIESSVSESGIPGGVLRVTVHAVPTGNYPALGEPVATLLAAIPGSLAKVAAGVRPSNATINSNLGHRWSFDPAQGTMGSLRNWTAISNTPTEHGTAAYDGNEATSCFLRITFEFPLTGSMTR